ncbi:MAG: endonuclease III [Acidobacteriota bacterium]|jgi:endonuclease-3
MRAVLRRLEGAYGRPRNGSRRAPLDELILTVLSQNTNDRNRDRAYAALRDRYPRWEDVLAASDAGVARTIRAGGLANQKAARIRRILTVLQEQRGKLDLEFLRRWSVPRAAEYLSTFQGVGEKTINCVLLFSMNKAAFPVDTHVHRLAIRLGFAPERAGAHEVHGIMHALVPEEQYYPAHMNLIRHGREICGARRPDCGACVLADLCPSRADGG